MGRGRLHSGGMVPEQQNSHAHKVRSGKAEDVGRQVGNSYSTSFCQSVVRAHKVGERRGRGVAASSRETCVGTNLEVCAG
eukprot:2438861-Rhodomonas_salina.3